MKLRYGLPLLLAVAFAFYLPLWALGLSGPGVSAFCALAAFLVTGAVRKWWRVRQPPEERES